ncbi:spr peptidase [Pasteurella langaaensis DSM 22999]|uniref:Spr peptidase n=1 Tax=Alitibacter langaaensis DSM 22999 TaxID=1122935 RepID=A0A2U0T8C5_9PAST|nr:NlpC/P60 family protein [Pasteurella langaaensis]PVX39818.1 spr peptidase [Pasteurella langaaensis DSM 22999]
MFKKIIAVASVLFLAACSSAPTQQNAGYPSVNEQNDAELTALIGSLKTNRPYQSFTVSPTSKADYQKLAKVYNQWAGTRYRMGGTGANGIDCSAFMQETFAAAFGISLPRSTAEQRYLGQRIQKQQLRQGDLVFFRGNRHVGVYMGNNKFMHASSSQGVTISSLDEAYWARTYTQSRRIL